MAWKQAAHIISNMFHGHIEICSAPQLIDRLVKGANNIRFEDSLNRRGQIKYLPALCGNSGGVSVDLTLQSHVQLFCGLTDDIYHVGSTSDYRFIVDAGLLAGRKRNRLGTTDMLLYSSQPIMRVS